MFGIYNSIFRRFFQKTVFHISLIKVVNRQSLMSQHFQDFKMSQKVPFSAKVENGALLGKISGKRGFAGGFSRALEGVEGGKPLFGRFGKR